MHKNSQHLFPHHMYLYILMATVNKQRLKIIEKILSFITCYNFLMKESILSLAHFCRLGVARCCMLSLSIYTLSYFLVGARHISGSAMAYHPYCTDPYLAYDGGPRYIEMRDLGYQSNRLNINSAFVKGSRSWV